MNIEFHKKDVPNVTNNSNNEANPSYMNMEFHKKENTKANKPKKKKKVTHEDEEEGQGPSYVNMDFHKKNAEQVMASRQRPRRRRDEDEDLMEIDFDTMKENSCKPGSVENGHGIKEEGSKKDGIKVEAKKENSVTDSDDGHKFPPSFSYEQQGTEKALKTEGLAQDPENVTEKGGSHQKPKPDLIRLKLPEPTDETTDMASSSNIFLAIDDYTKESDREVNLQTGASVEVLEQTEGGWWLVRTESLSIGWAPSNFLEKISNEELESRKELGLEPPALPPLRPPKSPRVHRMALHVSSEQKFWTFMRKSDPNIATCAIDDEKQVCYVDEDGQQQLTVMDANGNKLGEYDNHMQESNKDMKKDYICDQETGVCKLVKTGEDHMF